MTEGLGYGGDTVAAGGLQACVADVVDGGCTVALFAMAA